MHFHSKTFVLTLVNSTFKQLIIIQTIEVLVIEFVIFKNLLHFLVSNSSSTKIFKPFYILKTRKI